MQKISGSKISNKIIARLKKLPEPKAQFAAVLVGDDSISLNFLKEKEKIAKALGIKFKLHTISGELKEDEIKASVDNITHKRSVGGVIVQLPLPTGVMRHEVLNMIPPEKDVDVLGELAIGAFYNGHNHILPPSVATTEEILKTCKVNLEKSNVAVVGLGLLIGRPIAVWLMNRCKNLNLIGKEADIREIKSADVVISGVGKAGLIKPSMLKPGAVVIDFGYEYSGGKFRGDLDATDISKLKKLKFYTPTPGGTGPVLIAKLFENFYKLNG